MNKILLSLMLMFALSLTLVSAEDGYGCQPSVQFTDVVNNNGSIEVHFTNRCTNLDDILIGLSVNNGTTGWGVNCAKLNTTYINNTYQSITSCTYPINFTNLTYKMTAYCNGCSLPIEIIIPEIVEEVNETNETEVTPTPTPTPTKKKNSGGGSSNAVKCEDWSVCTDGTQTQQCERNIVKTRACESEVNIITNENGSYVDVEDIDQVDIPEPNTNEGFGEEIQEEKSNTWIVWLLGIIALVVLLIVWLVNK